MAINTRMYTSIPLRAEPAAQAPRIHTVETPKTHSCSNAQVFLLCPSPKPGRRTPRQARLLDRCPSSPAGHEPVLGGIAPASGSSGTAAAPTPPLRSRLSPAATTPVYRPPQYLGSNLSILDSTSSSAHDTRHQPQIYSCAGTHADHECQHSSDPSDRIRCPATKSRPYGTSGLAITPNTQPAALHPHHSHRPNRISHAAPLSTARYPQRCHARPAQRTAHGQPIALAGTPPPPLLQALRAAHPPRWPSSTARYCTNGHRGRHRAAVSVSEPAECMARMHFGCGMLHCMQAVRTRSIYSHACGLIPPLSARTQ